MNKEELEQKLEAQCYICPYCHDDHPRELSDKCKRLAEYWIRRAWEQCLEREERWGKEGKHRYLIGEFPKYESVDDFLAEVFKEMSNG